jgi:glycosyltransferase involved in cell wall biosynthesis
VRILYSHRVQSRDGQGVHIEELVAAFRAAGHDVLVVGPGFYDAAAFGGESRAVAVLRRVLPGFLSEVAEIGYSLHAYRRLRRAHAAFNPDLIYERYNLFHLAGTWVSRRTGTLFYLEVNSPLADERARFGGLRLPRLARALERYVWRSAQRVFAVTEVLRGIIVAAGVPEGRVRVTPNGVVPERFAAGAPRTADGTLMLGFVGFVREWHGLDAVVAGIAADRSGTRLALTIVGDGPVRADLERQAQALGIADRVIFTGVVDHARVPELVAGFDIALQPKLVAYASPLKVFDYMAAGRAIVAPDQSNMREVLRHEATALLFEPDAPGALWDAIARLVADPDLRTRLGDAARAEILTRDFTWSGNARRIAAWAAEDRGAGSAGGARAIARQQEPAALLAQPNKAP